MFSGDCRPYFHIHDHDFARVASAGKVRPSLRPSSLLVASSSFGFANRTEPQPPTGSILASTNPLVLSTLKHWPHVLRAFSSPAGNKIVGKPPGLTTERKRHLKKDAAVAKAVDRAFSSGDCASRSCVNERGGS